MSEIVLRDYQERAVERSFKVQGRPIFMAPTGSGKTICQAFVAKRELKLGNGTAILTPRAEIFNQTHGVTEDVVGFSNVAQLRAGRNWNAYARVHIVSWPTLIKRVRMGTDKENLAWFPDVARVLVDEAHLSLAEKTFELLQYYAPRATINGWTATPGRKGGRGLGDFYTEIVPVTNVRQLIADGHLNPCEYYGGALPDLKGLATRGGDWATGELSSRCAVLIGDVVHNWLRLASDRHTIVFAVDIAHGELLRKKFLECGVNAVSVHNRMTPEKRDQVVEAFKTGIAQVLINVTIASYGFDDPLVDCIVAARPTKSAVLWLQMLGRGMRPGLPEWEVPKRPTLVLDHADNTRTLGKAEDLYKWELERSKKCVVNLTKKAKESSNETKEHKCDECGAIFSGQRMCPKCGWEIPFSQRDVETHEADLVRIGGIPTEPLGEDWPTHEMFFRMLRYYSNEKKYKPMWAVLKFKEKAKINPPPEWSDLAPVPPSAIVKNWIISRNIAYAAARKKREREST